MNRLLCTYVNTDKIKYCYYVFICTIRAKTLRIGANIKNLTLAHQILETYIKLYYFLDKK